MRERDSILVLRSDVCILVLRSDISILEISRSGGIKDCLATAATAVDNCGRYDDAADDNDDDDIANDVSRGGCKFEAAERMG